MSIRYTERLADAGGVASVGSRGDSYDNALAESFNGLFKWQGSYGAFTISLRSIDQVCGYIQNQKKHHAERTVINALECCTDPDDTSTM